MKYHTQSKSITLLLSFYCYMHVDTTFEKLYSDRLLDNSRIRQLTDIDYVDIK